MDNLVRVTASPYDAPDGAWGHLEDFAQDLLGSSAFDHQTLAALFPLCGTGKLKNGENANHE